MVHQKEQDIQVDVLFLFAVPSAHKESPGEHMRLTPHMFEVRLRRTSFEIPDPRVLQTTLDGWSFLFDTPPSPQKPSGEHMRSSPHMFEVRLRRTSFEIPDPRVLQTTLSGWSFLYDTPPSPQNPPRNNIRRTSFESSPMAYRKTKFVAFCLFFC